MISKKQFLRIIATVALAVIGIQSAAAQAFSGRALADRERVSVSYYKVPPGKQDEWLALYKKWHRPIMLEQIKEGVTLSSRVFAPSSHGEGSNWDFAIVNISPAKAKTLSLSRGELIKKLYPDIQAYVAGERARWELTVGHWDSSLLEIDIDGTDTPSVYYPIIDGKIITE